MKKPIIISSIFVVLFFAALWMLFPILNPILLKAVIGSSRMTVVSTSFMGEEMAVRLKTAISFGILPLFALVFFWLIRKIKNPLYPTKKLGMLLLLISAGYLAGSYLKLVLLSNYVVDMENYRLSPEVVNSFSLSNICFYDYGLICAVMVALLIFLFAKKKTSANTL